MALGMIIQPARFVAFARPTAHVQAWRLGAWLLRAAIYGAHILYEREGQLMLFAVSSFVLAILGATYPESRGERQRHRTRGITAEVAAKQ
jgi:hypothetical protein